MLQSTSSRPKRAIVSPTVSLHLRRIRDVAAHGVDLGAALAHELRGLVEAGDLHVGERERRALLGQPLGGGPCRSPKPRP